MCATRLLSCVAPSSAVACPAVGAASATASACDIVSTLCRPAKAQPGLDRLRIIVTGSTHGGYPEPFLKRRPFHKDKREVDLVVVRDGAPWFLVEVKHRETRLSPALAHYQRQVDDSFTVTAGKGTGAPRVDGRSNLWEFTVEPDSDQAATITLPGGRDCGTTGAVCGGGDDPRPLTNSPSATVAGPPEDP